MAPNRGWLCVHIQSLLEYDIFTTPKTWAKY